MSPSLISKGGAVDLRGDKRMSSSSSTADIEGSSSSMTPQQQQQQDQQNGSKKRNRAVLSCLMCHQRRVKCDRKQPCEACINYGCASDCTYASRPDKKTRKGSRDDSAMEGALRRSSGQDSSSVSVSPSQEYANVAQSIPQVTPGQQTLFSTPMPTKKSSITEIHNVLPNPSFFTFVERFQQHTQSQDKQAVAANFNFYPMEAFSAIQAARLDLPVKERVLVLIQYYNDHLDWFHEIYDDDEVANWISPFLDKFSQRVLSANMLDRGDATKLCLIMTVCISSIQIMSEGLVSMFFLDSQPVGMSLNSISRNAVKERYEMHIRNLLDAATQYDGHSSDLVRCSLIYVHLLKNEGRHHESSNRPFITSISHIVEQEKLHQDPPPTLSEAERESRRKLFWTYYSLDRMTSAHLNFEIRIPDECITTRPIQKETWSPRLGRRNHLVHFHRRELCKIAGKLSKVLENSNKSANSASDSVQEVEDQLQAWQASLPPELQRDFIELSPEIGPVRIVDLQRRMLQIGFNATRAGLHRLCFFPTDTISLDRVQKSRRICVEAAIDMIKVQDGLRVRMPGDQNLRCFFISYFLVESAITLILTSLIDLGAIPAGVAISEKIQEYMGYAQRARDLISSLPPDFTPAVQGVRLLSRVLAKATRILDLHAQHKLTPTESSSAIRDVLCDEDGKQMPIPFYTPADGNGSAAPTASNSGPSASSRSGMGAVPPRRNMRVSFPSTSDTGTNSGRTPVDGITHSSSYSDLSSSLATPPDFNSTFPNSFSANAAPIPSNNYMNYITTPSGTVPAFSSSPQYRLAEPTYEDLGLEFFNSLANALPFPMTADGGTEQQQQQQQQQQSSTAFTPSSFVQQDTPQDSTIAQQQSQNVAGGVGAGSNFGLDDQMDIWLASLQTIP